MLSARPLLVLSCIASASALASNLTVSPQYSAVTTCARISKAISPASAVFYPDSTQYAADIAHYSEGSTQNSTCSVEPGTARDVGIILQILGETRTPFAVKGGGHTGNQGFSSTSGVHIAMTRFSDVQNNPSHGTVDVGPGLIWDDVYKALNGTGLGVVGGRVSGVGLAGFTLGGGYSWKTNQYGLSCDNVAAYELVLPNGTVTSVTSSSGDLWFALRGGFNNFGIVTKFTLVSHPQTDVWGGVAVFNGTQFDALSAAVSHFDATNTDKKAQLIFTLTAPAQTTVASVILFYDGPTPSPGIFDAFLAVPTLSADLSTRSFLSLVQSAPTGTASIGRRQTYSTVSILKYTPAVLQAVQNSTEFWSARLAAVEPDVYFTINSEPFDAALYRHAPVAASESAYPPARDAALTPLNFDVGWNDPANDALVRATLARATADLRAAARRLGQAVEDDFVYGNYALEGTPVEEIYGKNVGRLRAIKGTYDPGNVMGLAGGFKV
ncbi:FAD-binding domain-containing protein [Amylostereum chailletii]|nr:FAD-binding domain-containing protein [Amylostereum chailletii]